ncbi:hypothetical protein [Microbacterium sp. NPDC057650]|uniref:hypothetical protein n=1 Tax=unclassified Microbacterium TaxID=2609290 RepID=UPI00367302A5
MRRETRRTTPFDTRHVARTLRSWARPGRGAARLLLDRREGDGKDAAPRDVELPVSLRLGVR